MEKVPETIDDLLFYVENEIKESVRLDYKRSPALNKGKREEIAKDVSAFANSDGGLLIYGVCEENDLPSSLDDGVKHGRKGVNREWLEQTLSSLIQPKIDGLVINQIPVSEHSSYFVIYAPRSRRAPHMANNTFYKRYNFSSVPMELYEVEDIRNRIGSSPPAIVVEIEIQQSSLFTVVVENRSNVRVLDLNLKFEKGCPWDEDEMPRLFQSPTPCFYPKSRLAFSLGFSGEYLHFHAEEGAVISCSYTLETSEEVFIDEFAFDLSQYYGSLNRNRALSAAEDAVVDNFQKLTKEMAYIHKSLGVSRNLPRGLKQVSYNRSESVIYAVNDLSDQVSRLIEILDKFTSEEK